MADIMPPEPPPPSSEADYVNSPRRQPTVTPEDAQEPSGTAVQCSADVTKLLMALANATIKFEKVEKDKDNPHFKTRYSSLNAYQQATRNILAENGLVVTQLINRDTLYTRIWHAESGQWMQSEVKLYFTNKGAQAFGGELTYLKRYCYSAILNISSQEEDDDGHSASDSQSQHQNSRPPPRPAARSASNPAFSSAGLPQKVAPAKANGHAEPPHDPETGEIVDDPWVVGMRTSLEAEEDSGKWLTMLKHAYQHSPTNAAVRAIDAAPSVKEAMEKAPAKDRATMQAWRTAALQRLAEATFPADVPLDR